MNPNPEFFSRGPSSAARVARRDALVRQIRALGGHVPEPAGEPSDIELAFLERVIAWETAPVCTHGEWLSRHGFVFAPPEQVRPSQLERELWRLIEALATARVFLYCTDHLSDAELYSRLWHEVLPASSPDFVRTPDSACHWDFADPGAGAEQVWLTYYASDDEREHWASSFRDVVLPAQRQPPYHRDHRLPVRE